MELDVNFKWSADGRKWVFSVLQAPTEKREIKAYILSPLWFLDLNHCMFWQAGSSHFE